MGSAKASPEDLIGQAGNYVGEILSMRRALLRWAGPGAGSVITVNQPVVMDDQSRPAT